MDHQSVVVDGMCIDWDIPIPMQDGIVLRADVFRPVEDGRYGVILSYGPYAKGMPFQDGYRDRWDRMVKAYPEVAEGTSNKYQNFELVDPEKWVPDGYVCLRIDSRGAGRSPGILEVWSPREAEDMAECIEWAAKQNWSNGKIGINGISYFAMNQWYVASRQPPSLAAICVWEGAADYYRDLSRHGGILSGFLDVWFEKQIIPIQHGVGDRGTRNPLTGETISGPETLSDAELAANRVTPGVEALQRPLDGEYYRARSPDYARITVPLLSAGNWGGTGLHPRGNFEGFTESASAEKWLEVHGNTHFSPFYINRGVELQKRFFGHFLLGKDTGWERQPKVQLQIRHPGEVFVTRAEREWPLARTQWTKYYLDAAEMMLSLEKPDAGSEVSFDALGDGVTFLLLPQEAPIEITGPVALKLFVASSTVDADLIVALRVFDPEGAEVTFIGASDPRVPVSLGWLRVSNRKLDPRQSKPYRPYHAHDEIQLLEPGEIYEVEVEIWPTCIVVPVDYRIGLTVRGKDYENDGSGPPVPNAMWPMKGIGPFTHHNPIDRPAEIFGGRTTLSVAPGREAYLLLPVIP